MAIDFDFAAAVTCHVSVVFGFCAIAIALPAPLPRGRQTGVMFDVWIWTLDNLNLNQIESTTR